MAHADRSKNSVALIHPHPLIYPPVVNAPVGFVRRPVGVTNPGFGPVPPFDPASLPQPGFVLNPAVLIGMEHRRSLSLLQVGRDSSRFFFLIVHFSFPLNLIFDLSL